MHTNRQHHPMSICCWFRADGRRHVYSYSAFADHCARLQIMLACLLTYLLTYKRHKWLPIWIL